ncbi:MAG: hypothetical protein EA377_04120 [Phycisphaerales bacterium]|nr:MAG: hypothetical protein EA377_04120 [Phycisphaerales bacterium]
MSITPNDITLVLAAHGATDDPRCAAPVERHAEAIRNMHLYREVLTVYWKQPPYFADLYDLTPARDLLLVPVMTASGYYTNVVLPRELKVENPPTGRNVHVAAPIGELDAMADLVVEQAVHIAADTGVEVSDAHLLLIGHGTPRDPVRSGATTYRHAETVRQRNVFRSVHAGFLEQDPTVADAFAEIPGSEPVILVPYLIASGGHGADDIPSDLGVAPGTRTATIGERPVLFADAVGEHPRTVHLILNCAEHTLSQVNQADRRNAG